jgi:hypothetical protein
MVVIAGPIVYMATQKAHVFDFSPASGWVVIPRHECNMAEPKSDRVIKNR